jgi:hypothetical protein
LTWILPTFGRPCRCQQTLNSIAECGASSGIVWIDGDPDPAYDDLRLPDGWEAIRSVTNVGVCGVLNLVLQIRPNEPQYGFISDDSLVKTPGWSDALVHAAGRNGFAHSADGWHNERRMHGAVAFGGDLLRALGFWAPPGLKHSFVDDAWERLARALENSAYCPQIVVEHKHRDNGKAGDDATYRKAYDSFDHDRRTFELWTRDGFPDAVARAIPLVADNPARARLMRARSKSVMICTPIARHPCWQYMISLCDTIQLLDAQGIAHGRQFVIGSSKLPSARNELVARFLASSCTDLLFVDDDMAFSANSVVRLLASPHPVCAVVGRKRVDKPNSDPEVWCGRPLCDADGSGVVQDEMGFVQFERVGAGFLKIARSAFEKLIAAHPEWKRAGHGGMSDEAKASYYRFFSFGDDEFETGEDVGFCDSWRALGGEIWVDPEQHLDHVGEKAWGGKFSELLVRKTEDGAQRTE